MYRKGKKERNELYLPSLRYIVADDWIEKLGHDAFIAWLKFHTWVDRKDENREHDKIPYTLESTWTKLGMGKKKFYEKVIRPLWNYCLIDIVEYEETTRKSQKPKNIIVYESPMNAHETEIKPLEKLRDYDTEYSSVSQLFGRKGGRPQKGEQEEESDGFQMETVEENEKDGFQMETVDGFQMETVTVSKWKPNNVSNSLLIPSNKSSNDTNNNNNVNEINQAQKEVAATQEQKGEVVVVDIKQLVFNRFQIQLDDATVTDLEKLATKHNKDLKDVITQTAEYFAQAGEPIKNLVGTLKHGIQNGWNKSRTIIVKKPLPQTIAAAKKNQEDATKASDAQDDIDLASIEALMAQLREQPDH